MAIQTSGILDAFIAIKNEYQAKMEPLKKEISDKAVSCFMPLFQDVFEKFPDVLALRWHQYTPYFNDGDVCEFSVNELAVKMKDTPEDAGDYEDGFIGLWEFEREDDANKDLAGIISELNSFLSQNEEICETAFGDHAEITVTRENIEVDEYSHD